MIKLLPNLSKEHLGIVFLEISRYNENIHNFDSEHGKLRDYVIR